MILYFAGEGSTRDVLVRFQADALKTFAYRDAAEKLLKDCEFTGRFFLDSGAFSAFTRNEKIDIKTYSNFVNKYRHRLTVASNLDEIGDHEGTRRNQDALEALGTEVLPVWHAGEPLEVLRDYAARYSYMAIGGLVPLSRDRKRMKATLDRVFSIVRDKTRIHGFGLNATWAWHAYPFYSVDATSWLAGGRFRQVVSFKPDGHLAQHSKFGEGERTPERMAASAGHYKDLAQQNLLAYREAAQFATDLWKKRGVIWTEQEGSIKRKTPIIL